MADLNNISSVSLSQEDFQDIVEPLPLPSELPTVIMYPRQQTNLKVEELPPRKPPMTSEFIRPPSLDS
jgi:hypothetical protein